MAVKLRMKYLAWPERTVFYHSFLPNIGDATAHNCYEQITEATFDAFTRDQ